MPVDVLEHTRLADPQLALLAGEDAVDVVDEVSEQKADGGAAEALDVLDDSSA